MSNSMHNAAAYLVFKAKMNNRNPYNKGFNIGVVASFAY